MNQKIGNWPGVTVEKKEGIISGTSYTLVDLPGIYALNPYTIEENVAIDFLLKEKPDVVINVVDATNIERSLYLTTQLLELDCKVVVALNMIDIVNKRGIHIDDEKLEKQLGAEVCKISAQNGTGIKNLINHISTPKIRNRIKIFNNIIENEIETIQKEMLLNRTNKRFVALKMLENDIPSSTDRIENCRERIENKFGLDISEIIATERYEFLDKIVGDVVKSRKKNNRISNYLDSIFLNKYLAFPIFFIILFIVYYFSVGVLGKNISEIVSDKILIIKEYLYEYFCNNGVYTWLSSLVIDGIIDGVGAVLTFVPQLIILFFCISVLETSGYMSRISLMLDNPFRKLGLSGKSLIPFIVGSGCSVPGIMSARIIENDIQRKKTIILTPFVPCSAKLPIITLFCGYFFSKNSGLVTLSLYVLSVCIIIISALVMKAFGRNTNDFRYISELPEYKIPNIKYVIRDVYDKTLAFIKRAGSIILLCSIMIWILLSFSLNFEYGISIEKSILAQIGRMFSWLFYPLVNVNSWGTAVSILQGLVAKEQVISSMSIIAGLSEGFTSASQIFRSNGIFGFFTIPTAYAFTVFNLFSAPCISAISAMKKELGNTRKLLGAVLFQTVVAYIIALLAKLILEWCI